MSQQKIVVIGGVACGPKAAARIKRLNPQAEVTIIEKGELLSYAGCGLPYYISGEIHDHSELMTTPAGVIRDTHFFKNVKDIKVLNRTVAEAVDRERKVVKAFSIESAAHVDIPYDKLVLAVGSNPVIPPIAGHDLKGVNLLSTVEDARNIRDKQGELKGKNAVIIGAGLIGIEVTEALTLQGMNVTMIEATDAVMGSQLDPEMAFHVNNALKAGDVTLKLGEKALELTDNGDGCVNAVKTDKGEYPADMVLVAAGVRPETSLAEKMGLALGETGAIAVNEKLQTSDPDIYAGGDCVENRCLVTGRALYAPMGSTANKHGRVIADNICGLPTTFKGILGTAIVKLFNLTLAKTGLSEKAAREAGIDAVTVLSPSPDKPHFIQDAKLIVIKLVVEKATGRLIGSQITGFGEVAKRMEVCVTAMTHGATVSDITHYDLAYAPPFSPAMDNIIVAAQIAENKLAGIGTSLTPAEVKEKIDNNEDFTFLDVRSPAEFEQMGITDPRIRLIPLGKLRTRLDELDKDAEIITFCKISLRGYEAQKVLQGAGFTNVKFLDGGVVCWPYDKYMK